MAWRDGRRLRQACDVPWPGHGLQYARPYPCGWRCDRHAPWAMAGQPEPLPGPGWPVGAWATLSPISDSRVHDQRAIASGKRRSNAQAYRAAQAAVARRDDARQPGSSLNP
ncbi:hypothetical protein [Streptomyces ambofaciens]